ncbi:MAG: hypothetical protein NTY80_03415 [candidate division SR1 bacterium]|nr:hypothetical protein [candidate division SR1 bacterium]
MNNLSTGLSTESLRNVNALVQKIEGVCKNIEQNLAMCLELNSDSVAKYSVTTANKVESEFVDRIVLNIDKIKNHLRDLKKALNKKVISDMSSVNAIITSLQETSTTLNGFLLSNNFFNTTFQLPIMEIQAAIDQIFEEVVSLEHAHA